MNDQMKQALEKKKSELTLQIDVLAHEIYILEKCISERRELITEHNDTLDVINEKLNSSTQLINPADETE